MATVLATLLATPDRHDLPMTQILSPADAGNPSPQVRLVSIETATQLLGIGRTTVYDLINRGELRSTKIGRRTLLAVEDIDAFVHRKLASA